MNSPQFLQQMSSLMSNPAILDQIIASNPHLAPIAPQVREVFQSEQFRQMMSVPLLSRVHTNAYVHTSLHLQVEPRIAPDCIADVLYAWRARRRWSIQQPIRRTRGTRRRRCQLIPRTWRALDWHTNSANIHNPWTAAATITSEPDRTITDRWRG